MEVVLVSQEVGETRDATSQAHIQQHAHISTWLVTLEPESGCPTPHRPQPGVVQLNTAGEVLSTQRQPPKGGLDASRNAPINVGREALVRLNATDSRSPGTALLLETEICVVCTCVSTERQTTSLSQHEAGGSAGIQSPA